MVFYDRWNLNKIKKIAKYELSVKFVALFFLISLSCKLYSLIPMTSIRSLEIKYKPLSVCSLIVPGRREMLFPEVNWVTTIPACDGETTFACAEVPDPVEETWVRTVGLDCVLDPAAEEPTIVKVTGELEPLEAENTNVYLTS